MTTGTSGFQPLCFASCGSLFSDSPPRLFSAHAYRQDYLQAGPRSHYNGFEGVASLPSTMPFDIALGGEWSNRDPNSSLNGTTLGNDHRIDPIHQVSARTKSHIRCGS